MSSPGGRRSLILPSSGAGRAAIDPRGPGARGELPPRAHDDELQSALDRLSLSLERIHGLLGELQISRRMQGEPSRKREPRAPDLGAPEIRYGAGPSAFERR